MAKTHMGDSSFADYAPVSDRITLFYQKYPAGRIVTELHSRTDREITFRALVFRTADDPQPAATGWASEREGDGEINAVACLENTETSAIGRALANLGFTARFKGPGREGRERRFRERPRRAGGAPAGPPPPAEPVVVRLSAELDRRQRRANAIHDVLGLIE